MTVILDHLATTRLTQGLYENSGTWRSLVGFSEEWYFPPLNVCVSFFTAQLSAVPEPPRRADGRSPRGGWHRQLLPFGSRCSLAVGSGAEPRLGQCSADAEVNVIREPPGPKCWGRGDSAALGEHSAPSRRAHVSLAQQFL